MGRSKNGSVPRSFDTDYKTSYQKLREQRDELLAAVKAYLREPQSDNPTYGPSATEKRLRAAITKSEGR